MNTFLSLFASSDAKGYKDIQKEIQEEKEIEAMLRNAARASQKEEKKKEIKQNKKNIVYDAPPPPYSNATFGGTKKVEYRQGVLNGKGPVSINGYGIPFDGRIS